MALLAGLGVLSFGLLGVWDAARRDDGAAADLGLARVADRDPARHLGGPPSERRAGTASDPRRDADDPGVLLPLPFVLLFGIGIPPALLATLAFALPPAIRLTALGVRDVPTTSLEVAESFGTTERQALRTGSGPAREAIDHARREPDHHDGARHRGDRCVRRRGGAWAVGAGRVATCERRGRAERRRSRSSSWRSCLTVSPRRGASGAGHAAGRSSSPAALISRRSRVVARRRARSWRWSSAGRFSASRSSRSGRDGGHCRRCEQRGRLVPDRTSAARPAR